MESTQIQRRLDILEKALSEFKIKKEQIEESWQNDLELREKEAKLKEARRRYLAQKAALLNEPENRRLEADLKDLSGEIKDTKQLLGDELLAYFMKNNSLEYIDPNGQIRKFTVSAKFN